MTDYVVAGRAIENEEYLYLSHNDYMNIIEIFNREVLRLNSVSKYAPGLHETNLADILGEKKQYINATYSNSRYARVRSKTKRSSCGMGCSSISINYDGNIFPCTNLHFEEFLLGSIYGDIETLISAGKRFNKHISVDNMESKCYECKVKYFCAGGCRASGYNKGFKNLLDQNVDCSILCDSVIKQILQL